MNELEVGIGWIQESLGVERLEVDDLEPFRASDAESRLEEVDRTRLGGDVELLSNQRKKGTTSAHLSSERRGGEKERGERRENEP